MVLRFQERFVLFHSVWLAAVVEKVRMPFSESPCSLHTFSQITERRGGSQSGTLKERAARFPTTAKLDGTENTLNPHTTSLEWQKCLPPPFKLTVARGGGGEAQNNSWSPFAAGWTGGMLDGFLTPHGGG